MTSPFITANKIEAGKTTAQKIHCLHGRRRDFAACLVLCQRDSLNKQGMEARAAAEEAATITAALVAIDARITELEALEAPTP